MAILRIFILAALVVSCSRTSDTGSGIKSNPDADFNPPAEENTSSASDGSADSGNTTANADANQCSSAFQVRIASRLPTIEPSQQENRIHVKSMGTSANIYREAGSYYLYVTDKDDRPCQAALELATGSRWISKFWGPIESDAQGIARVDFDRTMGYGSYAARVRRVGSTFDFSNEFTSVITDSPTDLEAENVDLAAYYNMSPGNLYVYDTKVNGVPQGRGTCSWKRCATGANTASYPGAT